MSCRICGGAGKPIAAFDRSITSESKLIPATSTLLLCAQCGLLHSELSIDLDDYYARQYDAKLSDEGADEIISTADGSIVFRTDFDYGLMKRHVEPLITRDSALFELGCGRGRILSRLFKDGYLNLSAFDLSEKYREGAARFCGDRIYIGERPRLECDLAFSFFVLEHDTDPITSLFYLRSVIREGGHLFLMLPNYVTNVVDLACADHVNHFSGRYLRALLGAIGFETLTVDEESSIGAVVILARRGADAPPRTAWRFADAALVSFAEESSHWFVDYVAEMRRAVERVDRGRPIYLYGAGFYAAQWNAELAARGLEIAGLFDANPRKVGSIVLGHSVQAADSIATSKLRNAQMIVCVNPKIAPGIADRYRGHFGEVYAVG